MKTKLISSVLALALPLTAAAATSANPPGKELPPNTQTRPLQPAAPTAVSGNPAIKVAHTKLTSLQLSATNLSVGAPLAVKVFGTGNEAQCPATVVITKDGSYFHAVGPTQVATGAWPRVSNFVFKESGNYTVRISMTDGAAPKSQAEMEACLGSGAGGLSAVSGDGAKFQVADIPK